MKTQFSLLAWVVGCILVGRMCVGAEMGRQAVSTVPEKPAQGVAVENNFQSAVNETGPALDLGLNWTAVDWKIGAESQNDRVWAPELTIAHGMSGNFDLRAAARYLAADDDGSLDVVRAGVGSRFWRKTRGDLLPYAGLMLNYYAFKAEGASSERGTIGVSASLGVAYLINEYASARLGLDGETTLLDGSLKKNGEKEDVSLSALGLGIGVNLVF